MKKIAFIIAAASLFALEPIASRFGPVAASLALVWLAVLLALSASASFQWLAVAGGALGALGNGVLEATSPTVASAVLLAAAYAERSMRVRSRTARALHVLIALVAGGLAGSLSRAYGSASLPVMAVSLVVASVLAALPLLIEADDPLAHALEEASAAVSEPAKRALATGAELRRDAREVPLDRATQARVRTTWHSLLRLAEARVRLERTRPKLHLRVAELEGSTSAKGVEPAAPTTTDAVLTMLDQRISDHVSALARAYTAVDTARAASVGLDDAALKNVTSMGESLEEVSQAMVDLRGSSST